MNKKQLNDLKSSMLKWNWESKLALKNPKLFVLEQSRKDFMKAVGTQGVALAEWQLNVLEFFGFVGEVEQAIEQERARVAKEVEEIFAPYPKDTVWYVTGQDILERVLRQPKDEVPFVAVDNADPARIYRWLNVKTKKGIEQVKVLVGTFVPNAVSNQSNKEK